MGPKKTKKKARCHPHTMAAAPGVLEAQVQQPAAAGLQAAWCAAQGADDEDAAEFRREAAQLLQQSQRQTSLPGGLQQQKLDAAVGEFVEQTGISKQQAEDALLATAEQHHKRFDEWLNQAQMWLAVQSEVQDEAAKLKEAMEVSLREQEAARLAEEAGAPPLANSSEERLRKKFHASAMLRGLSSLLPGHVLFCDKPPLREQVKHKLVELLRLEANCIKWWPGSGTQAYFDYLAGRVCQQLNHVSSSKVSVSAPRHSADPQDATAAAAAAAAPGCAAGQLVPLPEPAELQLPGQQQGQEQQDNTAGTLQAVGSPAASNPGAAPCLSGGACATDATGAAADAARAAASSPCCRSGSSCRQLPDSEAPSEPDSSAAADQGTAATSAVGVRVGTRKRQPPARYGSSSPPAVSRKRTASPAEQQPAAKRQSSGHSSRSSPAAAAGPGKTGGSSAGRRSKSPPVATVGAPPTSQQASNAPAATGQEALPCSSAQQQQSKALAAQRQQGLLPPLHPQQQQQQALKAAPAAATAAAEASISGNSPEAWPAYQPVCECLSKLLDDELQHLRQQVFNMPEKWGAVPAIFQAADEQQQGSEGGDSDVELVSHIKHPAGAKDIEEPPHSPPAAPAAAAAAATTAAAMPPAAAAAGVQLPAGLAALPGLMPSTIAPAMVAAMAASYAGAYMPPFAGDGPAAPYMPESFAGPAAAAAAAGGYLPSLARLGAGPPAVYGNMQPFGGQLPGNQFGQPEYRASTNDNGTLVIEID